MARPRYALILLLLSLPPAALAQPALRPEAGVVLLRNGEVLSGLVTRAGDYYIVTLAAASEIRMAASEVKAVCGSLDEVYEHKARHMPGSGVKPHLDLAEWCLRQNLHSRCAQQLVAALRIAPHDERLKHLERRLESARTQAVAPAGQPLAAATAVANDEIEKQLAELPSGSVEKFAAVVQPILLNRCGNNQCHGPAARSEFRLLRPPEGQIASRRFTQRNLYAALRQLTLSNPEASPLITLPQSRHGTAVAPIFDKQSQHQLAELIAWARLTAPAPVAAPATITPASATLSQPSAEAPAGGVQRVGVMRPPLDGTAAKPAEPPGAFTPRDRFDPEIFNRRYHPK